MTRNALTIRDMGEQVCWMLIQQAMGMKDAKLQSDFMSGKVALLLFHSASLPERLCATAAVRQMGGSTIYQGVDGGQWRQDADSFQAHLFPIFGYFLDCLYVHGLEASTRNIAALGADFPIINLGSQFAHPVHALADIACMLKIVKDFQGIKAAWIGGVNGTLHSLIEAAAWFPFSLSIYIPPDGEVEGIKTRAMEVGVHIRIVETPEAAVQGASFIFAGRKANSESGAGAELKITEALFAEAQPDARLLVSATPIRAVPIAPAIFSGKKAMLVRQAEYRLCIHKRILHWAFA